MDLEADTGGVHEGIAQGEVLDGLRSRDASPHVGPQPHRTDEAGDGEGGLERDGGAAGEVALRSRRQGQREHDAEAQADLVRIEEADLGYQADVAHRRGRERVAADLAEAVAGQSEVKGHVHGQIGEAEADGRLQVQGRDVADHGLARAVGQLELQRIARVAEPQPERGLPQVQRVCGVRGVPALAIGVGLEVLDVHGRGVRRGRGEREAHNQQRQDLAHHNPLSSCVERTTSRPARPWRPRATRPQTGRPPRTCTRL